MVPLVSKEGIRIVSKDEIDGYCTVMSIPQQCSPALLCLLALSQPLFFVTRSLCYILPAAVYAPCVCMSRPSHVPGRRKAKMHKEKTDDDHRQSASNGGKNNGIHEIATAVDIGWN